MWRHYAFRQIINYTGRKRPSGPFLPGGHFKRVILSPWLWHGGHTPGHSWHCALGYVFCNSSPFNLTLPARKTAECMNAFPTNKPAVRRERIHPFRNVSSIHGWLNGNVCTISFHGFPFNSVLLIRKTAECINAFRIVSLIVYWNIQCEHLPERYLFVILEKVMKYAVSKQKAAPTSELWLFSSGGLFYNDMHPWEKMLVWQNLSESGRSWYKCTTLPNRENCWRLPNWFTFPLHECKCRSLGHHAEPCSHSHTD